MSAMAIYQQLTKGGPLGDPSGGRPPHLDKQYIRVERNCRRTRTDRYGISGRRMISWIIDSSSRRWISRVRHIHPSFYVFRFGKP
jgi:hypothetical protein